MFDVVCQKQSLSSLGQLIKAKSADPTVWDDELERERSAAGVFLCDALVSGGRTVSRSVTLPKTCQTIDKRFDSRFVADRQCFRESCPDLGSGSTPPSLLWIQAWGHAVVWSQAEKRSSNTHGLHVHARPRIGHMDQTDLGREASAGCPRSGVHSELDRRREFFGASRVRVSPV